MAGPDPGEDPWGPGPLTTSQRDLTAPSSGSTVSLGAYPVTVCVLVNALHGYDSHGPSLEPLDLPGQHFVGRLIFLAEALDLVGRGHRLGRAGTGDLEAQLRLAPVGQDLVDRSG
jgi:hypothetical protein